MVQAMNKSGDEKEGGKKNRDWRSFPNSHKNQEKKRENHHGQAQGGKQRLIEGIVQGYGDAEGKGQGESDQEMIGYSAEDRSHSRERMRSR